MEKSFWMARWEQNDIGFHLNDVNPVLRKHWDKLSLANNARVLVPLCGKSLDLIWLTQQSLHVIGVELSQLAIDTFCQEQSIEAKVEEREKFRLYQDKQLELWCGNLFDFPDACLETIQAVYDRGSLVALPPKMRRRYVDKLLKALPSSASWLLVTLEYDETIMQGPPFNISQSEVLDYFEGYDVRLVDQEEIIDSMPKAQKAGLESIRESVYVITPKK